MNGQQPRPANTAGFMGGSFSVGQVWGIDVQIHMLFVFWIAFCLFTSSNMAYTLLWNVLLFGSVFLHELGHCAGARQVGGVAKRVILYPLGGLAMLQTPRTAWAEFISTAAGPAVNLVLFLLGVAVMVAVGLLQVGLHDLDSITALGRSSNTVMQVAFLLAVVNLALFVFNVLPAFPMDGGRILRSMLWPLFGWRTATLVATVTAMVFGSLFVVAALLMGRRDLFLVLIGIYVIMASHGEFKRALASGPPRPPTRPTDDRMPFER